MTLSIPAYAFSQIPAFSDEERRAFESHRKEMAVPVEFLAADAMASIQEEYQVSPSDERTLRDLCVRMETHKYVHNYLLETAQERMTNKRQIEVSYWDSIASLLIPLNPEIVGQFVGFAVCLSSELNLSEDTRARLRNNAFHLVRRLRESPCQSLAWEEMDTLKALLTYEQIETVLHAKNTQLVNEKVKTVWKALETAGLTDGLNREADLKRASLFYTKEYFIKDYYLGDRDMISANLEDLNRHKPRIVNMYEGLRQKDSVRKRHKDKVGAPYFW